MERTSTISIIGLSDVTGSPRCAKLLITIPSIGEKRLTLGVGSRAEDFRSTRPDLLFESTPFVRLNRFQASCNATTDVSVAFRFGFDTAQSE